eukprot:TRINITY_DN6099_c0_g1_i2.p1 TRINITY_DN6099_c0_g1~~TRINITY_DN6099_c0_g1_i2.p1  ORF type:complete len:303 (+),score=91.90 TRINITY_DN6099_c0_g1_i2:643-1551(+)
MFQFIGNLAELYRGLESSNSPKLMKVPHIRSYLSDSNSIKESERKESLEHNPSLFHLHPAAVESNESNPEAKPTEVPPKVVGKILRFTGQKLEELKAHATDPNGGSWVSTFDSLCALLYQRVYQARIKYYANKKDSLSPPEFLTPVNLRAQDRLSELPSNYFPNALICHFTTLSHETLGNSPLWKVAKDIHELVRSGLISEQEAKKTLRWIEAQPDKGRVRMNFKGGNGSMMISSWAKFDMYVRFEEKPTLVSTPFTPISLIDGLGYILSTDSEDGSIDVNLALSEPLWEILEEDEQLRRFF